MEDNKDMFGGIRAALQQQIKEAYMEGAHQGAITTCAIIYETMTNAGLEANNFLIYMLKDIAHKHGCEDLAAVAVSLRNRAAVKGDMSDNLPPA
jgi:tRNA threonylcarbamoyladenosine modification (KEOPS) complex Cgi121 subunit